ncbi:MAG TPA: lipid-A-disaccharide synthase [Phycisphaerales bacterium]|nr:lipid-A-disaccharide synthase [Phycisphaerales bacterium]
MNQPPTKRKRIFISACEHSAEQHCANLIRACHDYLATRQPWPDGSETHTEPMLEWVGLGGDKMAEAGCQLLANPIQKAAMIYNVLKQLGYYRKLIRQATAYLAEHAVDLVVVCDSPAFNFHIAKAARRRGIPVLFYVAPQLWAWAPWRIYKLRRRCTKLACILPFEQEWFCSRGVDAAYVCNPLFDELNVSVENNVKTYADYQSHAPHIALMPGSRDAEIKSLWPALLEIAALIRQRRPQATFTACAADDEKQTMMQTVAQGGPAVAYRIGRVYETAQTCDFTLVASGSATLQVAAAGCPMVILYQSNKWLWHLVGRRLIRTRYLSLVNILARRELVPEYMPYFDAVDPIAEKCCGLLANTAKLAQTSQSLTELVKPLAAGKARDKTARIVFEMLGLND